MRRSANDCSARRRCGASRGGAACGRPACRAAGRAPRSRQTKPRRAGATAKQQLRLARAAPRRPRACARSTRRSRFCGAQRLAAVRERDDDALARRARTRASSFSASASPRAASAGRCASNANGCPAGTGRARSRLLERHRLEPSSSQTCAHLVRLPDEIGRAIERRHEVARNSADRLVVVVPASARSRSSAPLGGRIDRRVLDRVQRALRERRERAHLLDLVAEELDAKRLAAGRREDVDEPAADGELAALVRALDPLVAGERERLGKLVEADLRRRRRCGSAPAAPRRGGIPSASARRGRDDEPARARGRRAHGRARRRDAAAARGPSPSGRRGSGSSATRSSPRNHAAASAASRAS